MPKRKPRDAKAAAEAAKAAREARDNEAKQRLDNARKIEDTELATAKAIAEAHIAAIEDPKKAREAYAEGKISAQAYADELMKIEADVELESLKLQLANIETVKKAAEAANLDPKERAKLEEEASKLVTQIAETEAENRIKASEKVLEREKQLTEMRREVLASSLDAINEITAALVDAAIERIDAEKEASDELYAKQKEGLEDALMIEEMRAREEKRIEEEKQKREEAIAAKKKRAQNIANAIDMAVNIAKTIQATNVAAMEALLIPPPAGEIIATQRRIQGAIALATILATGIPKLEIGLANGIPNLGDGLEIGSRRACRRDPRAVRTHQRSRKLAGRGRRAVGRGHGAARVARDVRGENQRSSQFDDGCKGQSNLEAGEPDQELSRRYQRGE